MKLSQKQIIKIKRSARAHINNKDFELIPNHSFIESINEINDKYFFWYNDMNNSTHIINITKIIKGEEYYV